MAQEAIRERRVNPEKSGANTIADLRNYLYAEIHSTPENAAISFEVKTPDGKVIASDSGDKNLRVNRPGYVRIALRLPPEFKDIKKFVASVRCHSIAPDKEAVCRDTKLLKIVRLDRDFLPRETKIEASPKNIETGEAAEFPVRLL